MNYPTYASQAKTFLLFIISFSSLGAQDTITPTAVCDEHTLVVLDNTGNAYVNAITFDDGSTDDSNCIDYFRARRMDQPNASFTEIVQFDCTDIGPDLQVVMRVFDCAGNVADCMVMVTVEDKTAPMISCPDPMMIDCGNLSAIYNGPDATAIDNCALATLTSSDFSNLEDCGMGTIERTWVATDIYGNVSSCTQIFNLINNDIPTVTYFDANPPTFNSCGGYDYEEPTVNGTICTMVGIEHEDLVFEIVADACYKIIRTWKIMDWCVYDINNPANDPEGILVGGYEYELGEDGYMEYVQVLKFLDDVPPSIEVEVDSLICNYTNDCGPTLVEMTVNYEDDCTPADQLTIYHTLYEWLNDVWSVLVQNEEGEYSGFLTNGLYKIDYTVDDQCGNIATDWQTFEVKDCKNPTPYCINPTVVTINDNSNSVELWASDFDFGSYDNCTESSNLTLTLVNTNGFGTPIPASLAMDGFQGWTISCSDISANGNDVFEFELHVTDEAGNTEFCSVPVTIVGNGCIDPGTPIVTGSISSAYSEFGDSDVQITVGNTSSTMVSNEDGFYFIGFPFTLDGALSFEYLPEINQESINIEDLSIVESHILNETPIEGKYARLSADMNNSDSFTGADVVMIRRIILGFEDALENWRMHYVHEGNQEILFNTSDENLIFDIDAYLPGDIVVGTSPFTEELPALIVKEDGGLVNVSLNSDLAIRDIQFTIEFDPNALVNFNAEIAEQSFNLDNLSKGIISFLGTNLEKGMPLFSFEFTDPSAIPTLKITDNQTKSLAKSNAGLFTPTLKVETSSAVYPNPFTGSTTIDLSDFDKAQIQIFNSLGQEVMNVSNIEAKTYAIGNELAKGIYFVKISADGIEESIKIVKQ